MRLLAPPGHGNSRGREIRDKYIYPPYTPLALETRSTEVWHLLAAVKTEFAKYGDVLRRVQTKLIQASDTVESAMTRARVVRRKLGQVEQLPVAEAEQVLATEEPLPGVAPQVGDEEPAADVESQSTASGERVRPCGNCGNEFSLPRHPGRPPTRCLSVAA